MLSVFGANGWLPSSFVCAIQNIIVNQGGNMDHFDNGRYLNELFEHLWIFSVALEKDERGANALTTVFKAVIDQETYLWLKVLYLTIQEGSQIGHG